MHLGPTVTSLVALCGVAAAQPPPAPDEPPAPPTSDGATETRYSSTVVGERPVDPVAPVHHLDEGTLDSSTRGELLSRAAQLAPGLYVTSRGAGFGVGPGAAGGVHLRGLGGSPNTQVLVLEDGVPDLMGLFGHPLPDAYRSRYTAALDLVPGGDSVLYGSGAMAGVLLQRSKWAAREGAEFLLASEAGSYLTLSGQAGVLGRRGPLDYAAAVEAFHTDGHRDFADGDQQAITARLRYRRGEHLELILRQKTVLLEGHDPGTATRPFADHDYLARRFNQSLSLRHRHGRWSGFATLYANFGLHRLYDGFRSRDDLGGLWVQESVDATRWLTLLAGVDGRLAGGQASNTVTGADFGSHHRLSVGPYLQASATPLSWLTLVAGLRLQWTDGQPLLPLLKGGVEVRPWRGGRLFARAVQNFRDPTMVELYLPFPVANPALRPERSLTVDAGVAQQWDGVLTASLTVFRTGATDYIRTLGAYPTLTRENVASVTYWGLEGALRLAALRPVFVDVAGAYVWLGQYTAQTPALKVNAQVSLDRPPWRVALAFEYLWDLYQKDYRVDRLDDPWSLDARVDRWIGKVRLYALLRNLTDHRYALIADYPMPGLTFAIGMETTL